MNEYAILIIKKDNKYLQCFDKDWESYLFPNVKLINDDHEKLIKKYIQDTYKEKDVNIKYLDKLKHTKYSVPNKKDKEYIHYFYLVEFDTSNIDITCFYSMNDLTNNSRVMEVNNDIIDFVLKLEKTND